MNLFQDRTQTLKVMEIESAARIEERRKKVEELDNNIKQLEASFTHRQNRIEYYKNMLDNSNKHAKATAKKGGKPKSSVVKNR